MTEKIVNLIKKHKNIALFMHKRPDGDSISSSYGLALALKEKFPSKNIKVVSDLKYLKDNFTFLKYKKEFFTKTIDESYLTIVGDVADSERILYYEEYAKGKQKICFDHHQNKINFAADIYWSEPDWPASSLQAAEIAFALGQKFSEITAITLLTGILTDTGFFKYSLNNSHPVHTYGKLIEYTTAKGMNDFYVKMNEKDKEDLEIQSYIFSNLKYEDKEAYVLFKDPIIKKYGYQKLKIRVNSISNIKGTHTWAFFFQTDENDGFTWKGSLRSSTKDVNKIAKKHHGGGHIKASGCAAKTLKEVKAIIKELN